MTRKAIIDLGSNTIRLVVFEVNVELGHSKGHQHKERPKFKELINEKKVCGLSAYVEDDKLTEAGMEKAIDVLSSHISIARNLRCSDIRIFATAVIRNRANSAHIVKKLEAAVGLEIDLISGKEESRLGFIGATIASPIEDGLLIDIGGGSTELTLVHKSKDVFNSSMDVGCVTAFADCVKMLIPTDAEKNRIVRAVEKRIDALDELRGVESPTMYGIGGSTRAVGKMRARMLGSDKALKTMTRNDIASIFELAERDPSLFIHTAAKATPDRMHTLLTGSTILSTVMDRFDSNEIKVCKYGIREGFLVERCL